MLRTGNDSIRVVVVDDSPTVCELLVKILQAAEGIQVVGVGHSGEDAVRLTKRLHPDVVTMDVRLPKMDGLEATRRIMRETPTPIVIVSGNMLHNDLDLTFAALQAGALTVVGKPGLANPETCDKIVQAVRLMAGVPVIHHWGRLEGKGQRAEIGRQKAEGGWPMTPASQFGISNLKREYTCLLTSEIQIVGIAASTGGPSALAAVLGPLPAHTPWPILVVQHITQGFAGGLAEWLGSQTKLRVSIATHGGTPQPGSVLLAPDDYHMQVNGRGIVELSKEPPCKGLRPSANYLFSSLARAFGPHAMGIVLTGMGDDGIEGLEALHQAGGLTAAQDEQSCVVYGMPRAAVVRNAVDWVLPLDQMAPTLSQLPATNISSRQAALESRRLTGAPKPLL